MEVISLILAGSIGGAFVSAVLGPWIARRSERTKARSIAIQAIKRVEVARWATATDDEFKRALIDLHGAALVAGADRRLVFEYAKAARALNEFTGTSLSDDGIPSYLGTAPEDIAELLIEDLWQPLRARFRRKKHVRQAQGIIEVAKKQSDEDGDKMPRAYWRD